MQPLCVGSCFLEKLVIRIYKHSFPVFFINLYFSKLRIKHEYNYIIKVDTTPMFFSQKQKKKTAFIYLLISMIFPGQCSIGI